MDNVLNRPLFRHREARNRLNDIAGVQRFQEGGFIAAASGNPDLSGGSRAPQNVFADPSGAIMSQYRRAPIRPAGLASLTTAQEDTMAEDRGLLFSNALLVAAQEKVEMAQKRFENDPSGVNQQRYADAVAELEAAQGENAAVREEYNPGPISSIQDRGVLDVEGPEAMVSQMSPEQLDIFNNLGRAAENVAPETAAPKPVPVGPSGMEVEARRGRPMGPSGMEAEARRTRPPAPGEEAAPMGRSTMEADARDRGPMITDPAAVAAGLNAEDPAVREKTVADFMQEYAAAAPEYKGMDKNLLLAQIGFAIAAGESPNAMQNIANGLLAGSDAMLKDKAAKDEFDRQVQLAAMQYGFGEVAQERALGRQFTDYVTSKEVTYRGKKYGPNESIPVLHSDIINGRMPEGVISEATSDALATNFAAVQKSLQEQLKNRTLSGQEYEAAITKLETAAKDYTSANSMIPLLEASLERVNDEVSGGVTGADAWLYTTINRISNFVGLNPADQLENVEKYNADMQDVAVRFASEILGESGRTISDQDRVLIQDLVGLIKDKDFLSAYAKDPNILTSKIQKLIRKAESNRDNALGSYTTTRRGYAGAYSPGGADIYSDVAEQTFNPEALAAPQIEFEWDPENKRLVLKK